MTTSSRTVIIEYQVSPPQGVDAPDLATKKTLKYEVHGSPDNGAKDYYKNLKEAVRVARDEVGEDLTAWRDAVGKAELRKEPTKSRESNSESDEDALDEDG